MVSLIFLESAVQYSIGDPEISLKPSPPTFLDIWLILVPLLGFVLTERTIRKIRSIPSERLPYWVQDFRATPTYGKLLFSIFCPLYSLWYDRVLLVLVGLFVVSCVAYGITSPIAPIQTSAGLVSLVFVVFALYKAATMQIEFRCSWIF